MSYTKQHFEELTEQAKALGWADLDQMLYYEKLASEEYQKQVQDLPSPPPAFLHELQKIDPREVYGDYEKDLQDHLNEWAGVY